jgi:hypothetical protein
MKHYFTAFKGVPLPKPDSTPTAPKVRPIAIGSIFANLAGKLLMRHPTVKQKLRDQLGAREFAGMSAGPETFVHSVVLARLADPSLATLSIDFHNAFGTIPVQEALEVLERMMPELVPMAQFLMSDKRELVFSDILGTELRVHAEEGVLQGNPLSGAIFSLFLHDLLSPLTAEFPDVWHPGYYDDRVALASPERLVAWFKRLNELLPSLMKVQKRKTKMLLGTQGDLASGKQAADEMGVEFVTDGIVICGAPVGTDAFRYRHLDGLEGQCRTSCNRLELATLQGNNTLQMGANVIKRCIPTQLTHIYRSLPPYLTSAIASRTDELIYNSFCRLFELATPDREGPLGEARKALCFQPIQEGGFGFMHSTVVSVTGFIGSLGLAGANVHAAFPPQLKSKLPEALQAYVGDSLQRLQQLVPVDANGKHIVPLPTLADVMPLVAVPKLQASLTVAVLKGKRDAVLRSVKSLAEGGSRNACELLVALTSTTEDQIAGAWLTALPTQHTKLTNKEFSLAGLLRLGAVITTAPMTPNGTCLRCKQPVLSLTADHALRCRNHGFAHRHCLVGHYLQAWFTKYRDPARPDLYLRREAHMDSVAAIHPLIVPPEQAPTSMRKGKKVPKRMDFALHNGGQVFVLDHTIRHPKAEEVLTDIYGKRSGATAGHDEKVAFYSNYYDFAGNKKQSLWAIGMDSYGHIDSRSKQNLKALVKMLAADDHHKYSSSIRLLYSLLSVAICKGNFAMIHSYLLRGFPAQIEPAGADLYAVDDF